MNNSLGVYIHVPFCAKKCPYCDFYSVQYNKTLVENYVKAICDDITNQSSMLNNYIIDSIYFGGGTPSLLSPQNIEQIITTLYSKLQLNEDIEITMEANPNTITLEKLQGYYNARINRISFGVQSLNEVELKSLGRTHSINHCIDAIFNSQKAGFKNISIDLMIGTPHQTKESVRDTIEKATNLPITHISAYMLKVEENTNYYDNPIIEYCVDEDDVADIYLDMVNFFKSKGFNQYEISNFSKLGYESRHNLKYWECKEYIGLGPTAHSYLNNIRYSNADNIEEYINLLSSRKNITDSNAGGLEEEIMLGLRLSKGIPIVKFEQLETYNNLHFTKNITLLENLEYIIIEKNILKLTEKGNLISNSIINRLLNCR